MYLVNENEVHHKKDINSLEMIQRREARWVTSNYDWQSGISVSSTLNNLEWDTLALRRQISRLKLLYKAAHLSSGLFQSRNFCKIN